MDFDVNTTTFRINTKNEYDSIEKIEILAHFYKSKCFLHELFVLCFLEFVMLFLETLERLERVLCKARTSIK